MLKFENISSAKDLCIVIWKPFSVINQQRPAGTQEWTLQEFNNLEQAFPILNRGTINLQDLYQKIKFDQS
jgi:hypothetical protein